MKAQENMEELTKVEEVDEKKLFDGLDEEEIEDTPEDYSETEIENNPNMYDDFGDFIGEVPEIDYSTKIRSVLRFETEGFYRYTKGEMPELRGEYCFIESYDMENETLRVSLLGNEKESTFNLPIKLVKRGEFGKLPMNAKEVLKRHRSAYNRYESTKRYLSRLFEKIRVCHMEIDQHLKAIHQIGTSTFNQTLEDVRRMNEQEYGAFQNGGMYENGNNVPPMSSQQSSGFGFGNNRVSSGFDSNSAYGRNGFGNNSRGFGQPSHRMNTANTKDKKKPLMDKEGFQTFKRDLLGREKQIYQKSKRGKKRKKPTILLKPNKIYYIKLRTGVVMMIYVKNIEIAPKKYLKQYYSEFGMVEEKEISWFVEKPNTEQATQQLKQHYSRVFSLERQLERLEAKKAEKDAELEMYAAKRDGFRKILNEHIVAGIKNKEVDKCIRKEIDISFLREHNVATLAVRGIDLEIYKIMYARFKFGMPHAKYEQSRKLLLIPLTDGARYYEINRMLKELINYYGHRDKRELKQYVKEHLEYYF